MRGDLPADFDHLVAGLDDRGSAGHHRFGAAGAAAGDQLVAVALQQADAPERDAEPGGEHLGERRGVPLAIIEGAGDDRDVAIGLKADAAHLAAGHAGQFEIITDAAAAQQTPRLTRRLACGKTVPVGERQRLVEQRSEFAAVIGVAVRALVRHRVGRDVVAPTQQGAVDPGLDSGGVDQPLHVVIGLGAPGAAIGADRCCVGKHAFRRHFDQWRPIDA